MDNCKKNCSNCASAYMCVLNKKTDNEQVCRFWKDGRYMVTNDAHLPYLMMAAQAEATGGTDAGSRILSEAFDQTFSELNKYLSSFHVCDYPMVLAALKAFAAIKLASAPEEMQVMAKAFEDSACFVSVNMAALNPQRGDTD